MAEFAVLARRLAEVFPHENADRLDIGRVDGYEFVIGKNQYQPGQLGVYIPEGTVVPEDVLVELGYRDGTTNYLAGPEGNRVKAIRLRGHLSQGLFYVPRDMTLEEGEDVTEALGFQKHEPPIPLNMAGEVEAVPYGVLWPHFDVEDVKKYPDALCDGEPVSLTEKLHGTLGLYVWSEGRTFVASKGIAKLQLCLKPDTVRNVYWRIAEQEGIFAKLATFAVQQNLSEVALLGEVLGVQDLMYGLKPGKLDFYAFGLLTVKGFYAPEDFFVHVQGMDLKTVPELYRGPFSRDVLLAHTSGQTMIPKAGHIREGCVALPLVERYDGRLGRVMVKSVSEKYLLRKNATEFN